MEELESEWADPWEHARLLSDMDRNNVLIKLLQRHAPGATVIEVGCGTGVWSVLAAKLGARRVLALEPSDLWTSARDLVVENGLQDVVSVLPISVEALAADGLPDDWQGADLIFSELLNADPLAEGIVAASAAARGLLAVGGVLAPDRIELFAALAEAEAHTDLAGARSELARIAAGWDLDLDSVVELLEEADIEPFVSPSVRLCSAPTKLCTLHLGNGALPPRLRFCATSEQPAAGATLWWRAHYGPDLVMSNAPGTPNHWGQLVCAWPDPVPAGDVGVEIEFEDGSVRLTPAQ